ncbi:MAG: Tim44/TimA family putative adaptor protein [Alsobacter sp.]
MELTTIVFFALAVFVIWRLRSVLGTRTGTERPPSEIMRDRQAPAPANDSNVVRLDKSTESPVLGAPPEPVAPTERWHGIAEPGTPLAAGLDAIAAAEGGFDAKGFADGAKSAYEMIVSAFAAGDRRVLKDLLSREVFEGFVGAIAEREKRGEKVDTTFVSIDKAEIVDAQLRVKVAQVTVRFLSKLITATRDKDGAVIDGAPDKIVDVTDVWTFSREAGTRDPNWKLVATESGQ